MNTWLSSLWQTNIEISLLLLIILIARFALRKTARIYNSYLLWLSIPLAVLAAKLVSNITFSQPPPIAPITNAIHNYVVQPSQSLHDWSALGALWVLIAAILLIRLVMQHRSLRRELQQLVCAQPLGLTSTYPIVAVDKAGFSPAAYGFFQPKIYFPVQLLDQLEPEQIRLILRHEEQHIKQYHLWLNLFWDVLVCLMWFNPLAYLSRQSFRHDQELFCDYLVLNKSDSRDQQSYGYALLSTVSATHSVSLLCSWKTFNQLEERIMNIKAINHSGTRLILATIALLIVMGASVYSVAIAHDTGKRHVITKIIKNDDSEKSIKIDNDGKTYVEENGERYVLENDQRREFTEQELAEFERMLEQAETLAELKHIRKFGSGIIVAPFGIAEPLDDIDIELDDFTIIQGMESGFIPLPLPEEFAIELDDLEAGEHIRGLTKIIRSSRPERELELALTEIEELHADKKMDKKTMEKVRRKLESAREKLAKNREKLRESEREARAEIERLREEYASSRAH